MTKPTPRTIALTDQLTAVLRDAAPLPLTTNEIAAKLGLNTYQRGAWLWPILNRLARQGTIERFDLPDHLCRAWRLIGEVDLNEADR